MKQKKQQHKLTVIFDLVANIYFRHIGAAFLGVQENNLQHAGHEYRAAHEQEDHQAGQPLFSDSQEARLLPWGRALRFQLQAVDVGDGQDGGRHKPRQTHD